jgi:glycosyltransferase domain-containing protein
LLTLKDRIDFTVEIFRFYNKVAADFKFLVADGSSDSSKAITRNIVQKLALDIEYFEYPYDDSYSDYYIKLEDAANRVKTPYILLFDNDDYFSVAGCESAVLFLEQHPDYVAAGALGYFRYLNGRPFFFKQFHPGYPQESITERWESWMEGHTPIWGLVTRTSAVRTAFTQMRTADLKNLKMVEYIYNFSILQQGKVAITGVNPDVYRRMDTVESSSVESMKKLDITYNYELYYHSFFYEDWMKLWDSVRSSDTDHLYRKVCEKWFSGCVNGYLQSRQLERKKCLFFRVSRYIYYLFRSVPIPKYIKHHEEDFCRRGFKREQETFIQ